MRLIVTFEAPPKISVEAPGDLLEWLRKRCDAYFSYTNHEGNPKDGAVVNLHGQVFVGWRPSQRFQHDFDDWRDLRAFINQNGIWIFELSKQRQLNSSLIKQLNVMSQFTATEYRRL